MRFIIYIFYLYLIAFYYAILADFVSIYGVTVDVAALLVILVSLYRSESTSLWFSVAAAIVASTLRLEMMPWEIISLCVVALTANLISQRINLESYTSRLVTMAALLLLHSIIITIILSFDSFIFALYRYILPGTVYTLLFGWLYFALRDSNLGMGKAKVLS